MENKIKHQDWDTVYVHANKHIGNDDKKENKSNKVISEENKMEKKIEEGNLKHNKTPAELGKLIQSRRLSQNMTQKILAQKLNIPVKMINEIESGKAKHNPQVISKIKRILNISNK
jgi:ribosome-binding protein aMBF1 (putative translation factor)